MNTTDIAAPVTVKESLGSRAFRVCAEARPRSHDSCGGYCPRPGILLGIGGGLLGGVAAGTFHIQSPVLLGLLGVMKASGDAVFGALPLMFAIGVAIALSHNDGVAALAAALGYLVLLGAMAAAAKLLGTQTGTVLGFQTMDTGVFGGIVHGGGGPPTSSTASSESSCRPTWASLRANASFPS